MSEKLTKAQITALENIAEAPYKSGRFWRDLGISPSVISRLQKIGLVEPLYRPSAGEITIISRVWSITEAGRKALEEER